MIPKFLAPEVLPYAEILIVGLPTPPQKVICAWCERVIRHGTLPPSHGCCRACADQLAGETGGDR